MGLNPQWTGTHRALFGVSDTPGGLSARLQYRPAAVQAGTHGVYLRGWRVEKRVDAGLPAGHGRTGGRATFLRYGAPPAMAIDLIGNSAASKPRTRMVTGASAGHRPDDNVSLLLPEIPNPGRPRLARRVIAVIGLTAMPAGRRSWRAKPGTAARRARVTRCGATLHALHGSCRTPHHAQVVAWAMESCLDQSTG
ncbi:hypothetical protein B1987_26885 [Mycobacterium kansasii]|nr:hypothetical protein B1987_26885 [Mycobacterium kansasii]VBA51809.1 hypothetical protein LAUMK191_02300 [Mycobacterium attenuatum]